MKQLSINLPDPLAEAVEQQANQKGLKPEDIIQIALQTFLAGRESETENLLLKKALSYAGTLEGPPDLSTNPKYMEGFGS